MTKRPRFTDRQIVEALEKARGIQAVAARHLAKTYGKACPRQSLHERIKHSPTLTSALHEIEEEFLDTAEGQLNVAVRKGQPWAVQFVLKTKGKSRGYTERVEQTGPGGGPVAHAVRVVTPRDVRAMSDDEVADFIRAECVGS